jgi:hypothetical protein
MTANRFLPPSYPADYQAPRHPGQVPPHRHGTMPVPERRLAPQHGTGEWQTIRERSSPRRPPGARNRRLDASRWHWLLLVPIVVPLLPGLYNRIEPTFLGLPFFYWSQLSFAFLASAVITFVHRRTRGTRVTGAVDG